MVNTMITNGLKLEIFPGESRHITGKPVQNPVRRLKLFIKIRILNFIIGDDIALYNVGVDGVESVLHCNGRGNLYMNNTANISLNWTVPELSVQSSNDPLADESAV